MFKKHLVRNANVKILVSNYGSIPREISEQSWIESSGAGQHLESTTVEKIPSISITKSENDELGLHQGGILLNSFTQLLFCLQKRKLF